MKNLLLGIATVLLISVNIYGQKDKDVPAVVKNAFSQKFQKATKVKWSNESNKEWEAEFKLEGIEYSANFDLNGTWLETEHEIGGKEIPAPVKTTLDREFSGYKIGESEISETSEGKVYEFELKKNGKKTEVSIDNSGKVLEQEQGDEDDKD